MYINVVSFLNFLFLFGTLPGLFSGCVLKPITIHKNITYTEANQSLGPHQLTVYAPRKTNTPAEVLVFIHGGNWNTGHKGQYRFLGAQFARKGIVTVIIDYPLSPAADYHQMATAAARAVTWTTQNIAQYQGNPNKIYVSGHSAGGHLATLLAIKPIYFAQLGLPNPIKGVILIDAAGLDMYGYLKEKIYPAGHTYLKTFSPNPATWKEASPLYHLRSGLPPFRIYRGEKTYQSIISSNEKFITALRPLSPGTTFKIIPGKKHIGMITQFLNPWNALYEDIITFLQQPENSAPANIPR